MNRQKEWKVWLMIEIETIKGDSLDSENEYQKEIEQNNNNYIDSLKQKDIELI